MASGPHVRAWYWYAFAAEVFSACALAIFLPITLEHMAREIGFKSHDHSKPCKEAVPGQTPSQCKARILGVWVDTASFSMYVKSTAVLLQALAIISIGTLADTGYWRKRLLFSFAFVGSFSAALFLVIPANPSPALPVVAAVITLVGNVCYAASIVCANAYLPSLAREDEAVEGARGDADGGDETENGPEAEAEALLAPIPKPDETYSALLSRTIGQLSARGTAIGFFSGVTMLALLSIPVTIGKGSTGSLMLAIGLSGAWWAVFSVPAALGLPGGEKEPAPAAWLSTAWKNVGSMVRPSEITQLPNLFIYLLAWIFLSDGGWTETADPRIPYHDVHCDSVRLEPPAHVAYEDYRHRAAGAAVCRLLVGVRSPRAKTLRMVQPRHPHPHRPRRASTPNLYLPRADSALWRAAHRGGDVRRGNLVWPGECVSLSP